MISPVYLIGLHATQAVWLKSDDRSYPYKSHYGLVSVVAIIYSIMCYPVCALQYTWPLLCLLGVMRSWVDSEMSHTSHPLLNTNSLDAKGHTQITVEQCVCVCVRVYLYMHATSFALR